MAAIPVNAFGAADNRDIFNSAHGFDAKRSAPDHIVPKPHREQQFRQAGHQRDDADLSRTGRVFITVGIDQHVMQFSTLFQN